ncbi:aldehyde dehydrogenase family protein [Streptomyces dengpaensis]|uniref:Aldehyde dehydrogenase domain-containing protein n=1 Tax=Streptomyces dengpaensis TaxID=2049881 RepID=A0ABM6T0G6_9ACTN|nr:aldehyde dehydrogenase family protein [Streptomyces dengpaensis]AVH60479.1 hypothetical protein C4B68_37105 [Streptomyces dengpaensis]PIB07602.1 hypothetical protein B1C81_18940 [Streptomyces sp. HG99]
MVVGGVELSAAYSALPFHHPMLTCSPGVGELVRRAAAEHLTPVTLELGCQNPVVVGHDADLADAAGARDCPTTDSSASARTTSSRRWTSATSRMGLSPALGIGDGLESQYRGNPAGGDERRLTGPVEHVDRRVAARHATGK